MHLAANEPEIAQDCSVTLDVRISPDHRDNLIDYRGLRLVLQRLDTPGCDCRLITKIRLCAHPCHGTRCTMAEKWQLQRLAPVKHTSAFDCIFVNWID